jgi:glycosyltransferase involved in cell wall biosynthesis
VSVQAQTLEDWEAVVVDDGSTDDTLAYLRGLGEPRLRIVERAHEGNVARVRNIGVKEARGRWIAFLDSDDRWRPEKLEIQLDHLAREASCGWSYTRAGVIDAGGGKLRDDWIQGAPARSGTILRELLLHEARIVVPAVMVERELVQRVGGFDEGLPFCEDYDLWIRLARASCVVAVPELLCELRRHPDNTTRGQPEIEAALVGIYERYGEAVEDPDLKGICRAQEDLFRTRWANRLSADGRGAAAMRVLASALPQGAATSAWWSTLAKVLLRPVTPDLLRRRFRRPLPWHP